MRLTGSLERTEQFPSEKITAGSRREQNGEGVSRFAITAKAKDASPLSGIGAFDRGSSGAMTSEGGGAQRNQNRTTEEPVTRDDRKAGERSSSPPTVPPGGPGETTYDPGDDGMNDEIRQLLADAANHWAEQPRNDPDKPMDHPDQPKHDPDYDVVRIYAVYIENYAKVASKVAPERLIPITDAQQNLRHVLSTWEQVKGEEHAYRQPQDARPSISPREEHWQTIVDKSQVCGFALEEAGIEY